MSDGDLAAAVSEVGQVFDVDIVEPVAGRLDLLDDVHACPQSVADVVAEAHARVHVLDVLEYARAVGEVVVLGPVVVDRDLEVEADGVLFNELQVRVRRSADDDRDAAVLAVLQVPHDEAFVLGLQANVAAGDDGQAGVLEFLSGRDQVFLREVVRHVEALHVDVLDAEFTDDADGPVAAELPE